MNHDDGAIPVEGGSTPAMDSAESEAPASGNPFAPGTIRVGSPFAVDPVIPVVVSGPVEILYDVGPMRYTAMGSVAASLMVVFFAVAGVIWFPAGGALIAGLGCVLSIFGLYSSYRYTALSLLLVHLSIFVLTYFRSLVA